MENFTKNWRPSVVNSTPSATVNTQAREALRRLHAAVENGEDVGPNVESRLAHLSQIIRATEVAA